MRLCITTRAVLAFTCLFVAKSFAGQALKYEFKNAATPVYEIIVQAELADAIETYSGHIMYKIAADKPPADAITFGYAQKFASKKKPIRPDKTKPITVPPPPPLPPFGQSLYLARNPAEIVIDRSGGLIRSNRLNSVDRLPFMMGYMWALMVPTLPAGQKDTWKTEADTVFYSDEKQQREWSPGGGPMLQQEDDRPVHPAHQTIIYTIDHTEGNLVTVQRKYEETSVEKIGTSPIMQMTGTGEFVFDTDAGLVRSMEQSATIELNQKNFAWKIPVMLEARLLTDEETEKFKADDAERVTTSKVLSEKLLAMKAAEQADDTTGVPKNAHKTQMVGGMGGKPFTKVDSGRLPVIGFAIRLGHWAGNEPLRRAEPLFHKPQDEILNDKIIVVAKDGYVVGGIMVDGPPVLSAMRVIFMKKTDKGVDVNDSYMSPWYGDVLGKARTTLGGTGELVLGEFGRLGLNQDAIGLVMDGPKKADKPESSTKPTTNPTTKVAEK